MNVRDSDQDYAGIRASAQACGLIARGGFHPRASDAVPRLADGRPARTVVLVGNIGAAMWPVFSASPEAADGQPHPLDRWSRRVIGAIAAEFGGDACFLADGPPWLPFVAWARRSQAEQAIRQRLGELATWLGGRDYLEDRFSVGDIVMTHVLRCLRHTDLVEAEPALGKYQSRCEARPAFQRALADHMAVFAA